MCTSLGCWSISSFSQPAPAMSCGLGLPGRGFWLIFIFFGHVQGPVTVEESVRGVLRLLARLSATSNGTFWDWRGQSLPW